MILTRKKIQELIEKYKGIDDPAELPLYIKNILVSHFKFNSRHAPPAIRKLFSEVNDGTEFERTFETKKMKSLKPIVEYRTQDALVKQQTNRFARALATPDFLFTYTIAIGYKEARKTAGLFRANWIDVKDFFAISNTYEAKKLIQQASRNITLFGPGAFVFSLGVEKELKEYMEKRFTAKSGRGDLQLLKLFSVADITLKPIKLKKSTT